MRLLAERQKEKNNFSVNIFSGLKSRIKTILSQNCRLSVRWLISIAIATSTRQNFHAGPARQMLGDNFVTPSDDSERKARNGILYSAEKCVLFSAGDPRR